MILDTMNNDTLKKTEQLLKFPGSVKQYKLYFPNTEGFQRELSSRSSGLWNGQRDAEEKARAWANVAKVSCVADPHESKAKWATN